MRKIITYKTEERIINFDEKSIRYTLLFKNVRNLTCRFKNYENKLYVIAPINYSYRKIEKFLTDHQRAILNWVEKSEQKKIELTRDFVDGEKYLLLGQEYLLKINKVDKKQEEGICFDSNYIILKTTKEDKEYKRKILEKYYKNIAQRIISEEFQKLKNKYSGKIPYSSAYSLNIRKMKAKWGLNNSRTKTITIGFHLIFSKIEDIDYVIIHELCHCAVRDHGKLFYSYQEMLCPDYKVRKQDLNKNIHPFICQIEMLGSLI